MESYIDRIKQIKGQKKMTNEQLAERSGSILPGILLHFVNNCLAFCNLYLRLYAPGDVSFAFELFVLLFFPLFSLWLLYHARKQGFHFSAGLRPGVLLRLSAGQLSRMAASHGVEGLLEALGHVIEGIPVLELLRAGGPGHLAPEGSGEILRPRRLRLRPAAYVDPVHGNPPPSARRMLWTTRRKSTGRRIKSVQCRRTQRTAYSGVSSTRMILHRRSRSRSRRA